MIDSAKLSIDFDKNALTAMRFDRPPPDESLQVEFQLAGVAVVVAAPDARPSQELARELTDLVVRELSVHKRPREVRFVDGLPRNEMGKVQKTRLI